MRSTEVAVAGRLGNGKSTPATRLSRPLGGGLYSAGHLVQFGQLLRCSGSTSRQLEATRQFARGAPNLSDFEPSFSMHRRETPALPSTSPVRARVHGPGCANSQTGQLVPTQTPHADASRTSAGDRGRHVPLAMAYVAFQLALLAAVVAATQWNVTAGAVGRNGASEWASVPVAIAHSQAALAAIWVVFGGPLQPWRLLIVAAGVCALAGVFETGVAAAAYRELSHALGGQVVVTTAALLLVRCASVQLIAWRPRAGGVSLSHFSVASLLRWVTAWCLILALSRTLAPLEQSLLLLASDRSFAVESVSIAAAAAAALWIAFCAARAPIRAAALLFVCAALFALISPLSDASFWNHRARWQGSATFCVVYPSLAVAWLLPLRRLGYRLQRDLALRYDSQ